MGSIILAFGPEKGSLPVRLKKVLSESGFLDIALAQNAYQVLSLIQERDCGILVSPVRLGNTHYRSLREELPEDFILLLLDSPASIAEADDPSVPSLSLPVRRSELTGQLSALDRALEKRHRELLAARKKQRKPRDDVKIQKAKAHLMKEKGLTEPEAYRYLQKTSMNAARSITETAEMILLLSGEEGS